MRKSLFAFAIALGLTATGLAGPGKYNKVLAPGDKAPDFSGIQAVMGEKDATLSLADMKEDVVVIAFLANHCPYVGKVEDRVIDLAKQYQDKNVRIVAVCVTPPPEYAPEGYNKEYCEQDTLAKIRERVKDKNYPFAYGRDDSQKIGRDYGAVSTPTFFVLDKERKVRYEGAFDDSIDDESKAMRHYVRDAIDQILAGKNVEVEETNPTGCGISYRKTE